jgi:phi LC3 family holin
LLARLVFNNLRAFDVVPVVTESLVMNIAGQVLTFLGLIGVIVDPTTAGVGDSERALGYEEPWEDPEK